jgi:hypothetical protein
LFGSELPERAQALVANVVGAVAGRKVFSLRLDPFQMLDVSNVYRASDNLLQFDQVINGHDMTSSCQLER